MKNVLKIALCANFAALVYTPVMAHAQTPTVEGNVAVVSDYRFRGVSLSDQSIALQGGLDLGWESGFYVGLWGSSIEPVGSSELELDLYAGYGGETASGLGYDVGALVYTYPDQSDAHYLELYGSLSQTFGVVANTVGVAWAPEQDNIGGDDNLYLYYAGETAITGVEGLSLGFGFGYETGAFGDLDGDGDDKWDWTVGLTYASSIGLDFGVAYIDTTEDTNISEEQIVFSIGRPF
ncbi:TorF family putative porin [Maricaulaceae bacterium MS644]